MTDLGTVDTTYTVTFTRRFRARPRRCARVGPRPLPTGTGPERAIAGLRNSRWEVIEWTIEPCEDGSTYTLAHHGLTAPVMERESIAWGWHGFLDQLDATSTGRSPLAGSRA